MKLRGGEQWTRGDVLALIGVVAAIIGGGAAILAIPGMPKIVDWDSKNKPTEEKPTAVARITVGGRPSEERLKTYFERHIDEAVWSEAGVAIIRLRPGEKPDRNERVCVVLPSAAEPVCAFPDGPDQTYKFEFP